MLEYTFLKIVNLYLRALIVLPHQITCMWDQVVLLDQITLVHLHGFLASLDISLC